MTNEEAKIAAKLRWPEKYPMDVAIAQLRKKREAMVSEASRIDDVIRVMETFMDGAESRAATAVVAPEPATRTPLPVEHRRYKARGRIPKICLWCKKPYKAKRSHSRFHSKECHYAWSRSRYGGFCERPDCRKPWTSDKADQRFCSHHCAVMGSAVPGRQRQRQEAQRAKAVTLIPGDNTRA